MGMVRLKCAECQCVVDLCKNVYLKNCTFCTKGTCCCLTVHKDENGNGNGNRNSITSISIFLNHTKRLFAAAFGIEVLCISAAVIGENSALYFFGYSIWGIILGFILGFAAAGFTTLVTILGRYDFNDAKIDSCCSVLEQQSEKGFISNVMITFKNFGIGISKIPRLHRQANLKQILKSSIIILVTAESACILVAETVDLFFYKLSVLVSIPLALLAGAFTVVIIEAYRKMKNGPTACTEC